MIINGGSRRSSSAKFFARHLLRQDNERVAVIEIRGVAGETVRAALHEMAVIADGARRPVLNGLYHAHLNPRNDETLTAEQWEQAADILERHLGLTGQPRVVVEHQKSGRTHRHIIWSRIAITGDGSLRAISDALTYASHEAASREIEQRFGHPPVASVLVKDRKTPRPPRRPRDAETFRGQESGRDPQAIKAEVTSLWHAADSGAAFATALAQRGYILARGDRRDFVLVDAAGDDHSLARRLDGIKAAEIRIRLAAIDRAALPSVAEARTLARQSNAGSGAALPGLSIDRPASRTPPRDPATAAAQVRQVTAQYARHLRRGPAMPPPRVYPLPRPTATRDAAEAAAQIEAITRPLVLALVRSGIIPQLVTAIVETGLSWMEQAAHYAEELIEDVRDTLMGRSTASRG